MWMVQREGAFLVHLHSLFMGEKVWTAFHFFANFPASRVFRGKTWASWMPPGRTCGWEGWEGWDGLASKRPLHGAEEDGEYWKEELEQDEEG